MSPKPADFRAVRLLAVDIDGTLTDGYLYWGGPDVGWTQRFTVRDGEAILRLRQSGVLVVPISRNRSACAKARMAGLGLEGRWVGVDDKMLALAQVEQVYALPASAMAYVGDGKEDVPILTAVGVGCAPADGHPKALQAADFVTTARGGSGAVEEVCELIEAAVGRA